LKLHEINDFMRDREKLYLYIYKKINDYILSRNYSAADYSELCTDLEFNFPLESEHSVQNLEARAVYPSPTGVGYIAMGYSHIDNRMHNIFYWGESPVKKRKHPVDIMTEMLQGYKCAICRVPIGGAIDDTMYVFSYTVFLLNEEEVRKYYYDFLDLGMSIFQVLSLYYRHFRSYKAHYLKYFASAKKPMVYHNWDTLDKTIYYLTPAQERKKQANKKNAFVAPPLILPGKILGDCFKHFAKMTKKLLSIGIHGGMREVQEKWKRLYIDLTVLGDGKR